MGLQDKGREDGMACIEGSLLDLLGQLAIVPSVVAWLAPLVYL